ncbi:MAG: tRNA (adenosine(37)-N6)-threonylcarbamoyltransferase complex ATPase subunit type 1 TsaE [Tannerella sp.]|jgi:tRNA threonylcarbamoyladenosine biosynthesis protein TsaE|nr:tRNA (adenosine(37)-N6)-threonylcarbamoyltransferase complex ATPase subunit type 1 TsaE [Tannerella sp.]
MVKEFEIASNSEAETKEIAKKTAQLLRSGDIIVLDGDLGAGKTHFVKGFAEGFHCGDPVTSPTFSIANFYRTDVSNILHIDLYRISTIDEFNDLGLVDYYSQSIVIIEWGKKFAVYFEEYLLISFKINDDNTRILTFAGYGNKYGSIFDELKHILKEKQSC